MSFPYGETPNALFCVDPSASSCGGLWGVIEFRFTSAGTLQTLSHSSGDIKSRRTPHRTIRFYTVRIYGYNCATKSILSTTQPVGIPQDTPMSDVHQATIPPEQEEMSGHLSNGDTNPKSRAFTRLFHLRHPSPAPLTGTPSSTEYSVLLHCTSLCDVIQRCCQREHLSARLEGLEPPTLGSEDRCAIHCATDASIEEIILT